MLPFQQPAIQHSSYPMTRQKPRAAQHIFESTSNYGKFKISGINRNIDQKKVQRLADSIEKKNLLAEFPIVVDKDFVVIDGQHRLKAAEILNVPIYYIISERATVDDITTTSAHTSQWKIDDYMKRWLAENKIEYIKLNRFILRFPFMSISAAASLCHYGNKDGIKADFMDGSYICNDIAFATRVGEALLDFSKHFKYFHQRAFVVAVSNLLANQKYDHKIMMARLEYQGSRLVRCGNADDYINLLNELYNHRTRSDNKIILRKLASQDSDYRTDRKQRPIAAE